MNEMKTNILVWQWGRKGAGPKIAIELSKALKSITNAQIHLSLSDRAEIIKYYPDFPIDISFRTYSSTIGYITRWLQAPLSILQLSYHLKKLNINLAICTMPGLLDMLMVLTLKLQKIPYVVVIHDASPHPGDGYFCQYYLQKHLIKHANLVVTLSQFVYNQLLLNKTIPSYKLIKGWHPPLNYSSSQNYNHNKTKEIHLLNFGRLLPYKGFNLLDKALDYVHPSKPYTMRIIGQGPKSKILTKLNNRTNVFVENRWVPEDEIAAIIEWADAIILPYEEASQSGVLAIALAFGKPVLITKVGGLIEQCKRKEFVFLCDPTPQDIAKGIEQILNLTFPLNQPSINVDQEWKVMSKYLIQEISKKIHLKTDLKIT